MTDPSRQAWSQTNLGDEANGYLFTFASGDRIVLSDEDLQGACRFADRRREFRGQFRELFEKIDHWVNANLEKIDRVHLSFAPKGIDLTVVRKGLAFDREFNRSLTRLDIEVARDERFNLIDFHVMVLPFSAESTVRSFVGPDEFMRRDNQDPADA